MEEKTEKEDSIGWWGGLKNFFFPGKPTLDEDNETEFLGDTSKEKTDTEEQKDSAN